MNKNYISEIQSLRGFSILIVLLFHFFPEIMPRGYLGVDIFFVISGYLMSKIISERINKKNFDIFDFYKKRFKRIIPNLLFIILVIYLISLFILLPNDFNNLKDSINYTFFLIPNIYFWLNGGYFGLIDELKPLLHLWSIGIEIQFYILIPLIYLIYLKFFSLNKLNLLIIFIFLISIFLNYYINFLDGSNFSFFMIFTRFWEFMIGSLAFHSKKKIKSNYFLIITILILCFILINGFSNNLLNQIFVVLFATSILITNYKENIFKKVIDSKILASLGLISYSLYLWHWPLISLLRYYSINEPDFINKLLVIIISLKLSYLTFYFIENNFRFKFNFKKNSAAFLVGFCVILIITDINQEKSIFFNSSKAINVASSVGTNFRCSIDDYVIYAKSKACLVNEVKKSKKNEKLIALYGNSHAQMYGYAFKKILERNNQQGIVIPLNACLPTIDINISKKCLIKSKTNFNNLVSDKNIHLVIIGLNYNHERLIDEKGNIYNNKKLKSSISKLINNLLQEDKKVILIGPIAEPSYNFPLDFSRNIFFKKNINLNDHISLSSFRSKSSVFFGGFIEKENENFQIFLPHLVQCKQSKCNYILNDNSLFADNNHLSKFGSLLMEKQLSLTIKNINK
jgi:peptidoglycan/LPS O-acetylase OafA/YrhL